MGASAQVQYLAALRFLYRVTLGRPEVTWEFPGPRKSRRAPVVLSRAELAALMACTSHPKHRALFALGYGSGLRVSEAAGLRMDAIDSTRGVLHVRQGKGGKDRCTLLSPALLSELRAWWRVSRPSAPCTSGRSPARWTSSSRGGPRSRPVPGCAEAAPALRLADVFARSVPAVLRRHRFTDGQARALRRAAVCRTSTAGLGGTGKYGGASETVL